MAITSKENEVLTAPPESAARSSATPAPRFDETATGSRPQPVALEVPVTVNGARAVEGTDKREPFSETTKTVLVFGNGAVIRLGSPVAAGQLLFLTNEKTKKEVVCQVVKSKNYKSVSGYVELEFTESVVGFWGMRFPSDRIGTPAPAPSSVASVPSVVKPNPVVPAPKPVSTVVSSAPKAPEVKPAQIPSPQIHAEAKPAPQIRPAEVAAVPPAPKLPAPPVQAAVVPPPPFAKQPDVPVIPASPLTSSLASSLASLLSAPEVQPASASLQLPAVPLASETKAQPSTVPTQNPTEDLKLQAARLQEQLSSLLFSAAPTAQPTPPAPVVPALDPKSVSGVASQVFEMAKAEHAPVKSAPPARPVPPPMKSSLDTEEVKIPSWLEPLARNAASPVSTPETAEREKSKHFSEITEPLGDAAVPLQLTAVESIPESAAVPTFGSLLPLDEPVITEARSSGSNKGVLYGAIAAAVLVAAGGAWYLLHPSNAAQGTPGIAASTPSSQASAALPVPSVTQPPAQTVAQPASQNIQPGTTPNYNSSATPISTTPVSSSPASSAPLTRPAVRTEPVPATRENTRAAATPIPASETERISRPPAEPEPKKPALGEVHLASPTINRRTSSQEEGAEAPTISAGTSDPNAGGMAAGLAPGSVNQPAAPEVPLPVGGDVKTAKLISSVSPTYPLLAKNQHISGDVLIDALIDANGRVTTMKVISGPTLLHQSAMAALRLWKYQPASLDGKPVPMHLTVTLQFRLQ